MGRQTAGGVRPPNPGRKYYAITERSANFRDFVHSGAHEDVRPAGGMRMEKREEHCTYARGWRNAAERMGETELISVFVYNTVNTDKMNKASE